MFNKTFEKYDFYLNRDFIYKTRNKNSQTLICFKNFNVVQKCARPEEMFATLSSFILLFDQAPFALIVNKSTDNKIKGTLLGLKCKLSVLSFFCFFFRLKNENFINIETTLSADQQALHFFVKNNNFDEFLVLYEKYQNLLDILVTIYFDNCYTREEKNLLISSFNCI